MDTIGEVEVAKLLKLSRNETFEIVGSKIIVELSSISK